MLKFNPHMYPTLHLGPYNLSTHTLLNVAAGSVAFAGIWWRSRRTTLPRNFSDLIDIFFHVLIGGCLGAWLAASLPSLFHYLNGDVNDQRWWASGNQWMGVLAGSSLATYWYYKRRGLPYTQAFEVAAPLIPLVQAVGRVGCLLHGDAYGRPATGWPAMLLPDVNGVWVSRYPTQLVDILANLVIFFLLLLVERLAVQRTGRPGGWPFDGFTFLLYIILYSVQRSIFEFWRGDMPLFYGALTWTHFYCAIAILLALWGMARGFRQRALHTYSTP